MKRFNKLKFHYGVIPYGRQSINASDIKAVVDVLKSDFLTQGPQVEAFEHALAKEGGANYALVFSSGTAALHASYFSAGLTKGDEFITSPLTFAATANAGLYLGATPVFADVDEHGNLDPKEVQKKVTSKTKAMVAVDYGGFPAKLSELRAVAKEAGVVLIEDACHALGATFDGKPIGTASDLTVFSFHPVKSITTGEGGAVLTDSKVYYEKMKMFRSHGITKDTTRFKHPADGDWYSEMQLLGFNYRMTDIQASLGLSQLKRLRTFIAKRHEKALRYEQAFAPYASKMTLPIRKEGTSVSALHLYPVRFCGGRVARKKMFTALREAGIGAQVHYLPVYLHPYYKGLGYQKGLCPRAEAFYESVLSLPLFPDLRLRDQRQVIQAVIENL
ncbi:MAG: UDP-4-amino-4,6-dideoxy-N-acetyl-beta-L-altrosamine transaminase [bacterium]|nr:UDP-4-amino-4,6-dideoxy-N-acetyl-beta-L-altrosamine transaminase [bacterium]